MKKIEKKPKYYKFIKLLAESGEFTPEELAKISLKLTLEPNKHTAYENGYQFYKELVAIEIKKLLKKLGVKF